MQQSLHQLVHSLEQGPYTWSSIKDLIFILNKCSQQKNQTLTLRLHDYLHHHNLVAHRVAGNSLVSVLCEIGYTDIAFDVFQRLSYRSELGWNSLIIAYVNNDKPERALNLYAIMQKETSIEPSSHALVSLLKACSKLKDHQAGHELHIKISKAGLVKNNLCVGSALINMYGKCSMLNKALDVFNELPTRNAVSWNTVISAYADNGHHQEALRSFDRMQFEGIIASQVTFLCILKCCSGTGEIHKGQHLHAKIQISGQPKKDLAVGNMLVDMYAKCGPIFSAQEAFDHLPVHDVISWNALISGYVGHGHSTEALICYEELQFQGLNPDSVTFLLALKACRNIEAIEVGQEAHVYIERKGLLQKCFTLGNALVDMYGKTGSIVKAAEVFEKLLVRDIITWNALIEGYANHGYFNEVLMCFEQMQHERVTPDSITYLCCLKACGKVGTVIRGLELHNEIDRNGFLEKNLFLGNALVDMYAKCGSILKSHEVFDNLSAQNVVSWTTLITGYAENGCSEKALELFEQMHLEGVTPNSLTFVAYMKSCGEVKAVEKISKIHVKIATMDMLKCNSVVSSTLLDMYAKCGCLMKAEDIFYKFCIHDIVSWTTMIAGYAENGGGDKAIECFEQMQLKGIRPDILSFVCCLKACGCIGAIKKGLEVHSELARTGLMDKDIIGKALVDMYARCGSLSVAKELFEILEIRDVVVCNSLIKGYVQREESENVFHIFDRMVADGMKPDPVTFIIILNACSHSSLLDKSQTYIGIMSKDYGFIPEVEHYNCFINVLGYTGLLQNAVSLIKKFRTTQTTYQVLLRTCMKWGNVQLGVNVFHQLF